MKKTLFLIILTVLIIGLFGCQTTETEKLAVTPKTSENYPWIELEGVSNIRQITAENSQNIIIRSSELAYLSENDIEILSDEYNLSYILDFRDEVEVEDAPDPQIEGVDYFHLNVWTRQMRIYAMEQSTVGGIIDAGLYVENYYRIFAFDENAVNSYRKMFEILSENDGGSVLIHCVHGKDRTGVATTLILTALGATWETIESEYLLSNIAYSGSVDISTLRFYRQIIEESYGSIENYLREVILLSDQAMENLRKKYVLPF